jgi:uncharacterized protein (TIGR01777 family)
MKILVTGGTGLIGSELIPLLIEKGHEVVLTSRDPNRALQRFPVSVRGQLSIAAWKGWQEVFPREVLRGVEAVFHLMGENIGGGRWTEARKGELSASRVASTEQLVQQLPDTVKSFICASAIGIYPPDGRMCDEHFDLARSTGPSGFLEALARQWEAAAMLAQNEKRRAVCLRFGVVLGRGGLLERVIPLYKFGLGGPLGSGTQLLPWVHVVDAARAASWVLHTSAVSGPVNVVGPECVSLRRFSADLAHQLGRPHFFRVPGVCVRLVMGEQADLVLGSHHVVPAVLRDGGFNWLYETHRAALESLLTTSLGDR